MVQLTALVWGRRGGRESGARNSTSLVPCDLHQSIDEWVGACLAAKQNKTRMAALVIH